MRTDMDTSKVPMGNETEKIMADLAPKIERWRDHRLTGSQYNRLWEHVNMLLREGEGIAAHLVRDQP